MYSVCEKLLVKNHGGCWCKNFAKYEFWKIEHVKLFSVEHNSFFLGGILQQQQQQQQIPFRDVFPFISFFKNISI